MHLNRSFLYLIAISSVISKFGGKIRLIRRRQNFNVTKVIEGCSETMRNLAEEGVWMCTLRVTSRFLTLTDPRFYVQRDITVVYETFSSWIIPAASLTARRSCL